MDATGQMTIFDFLPQPETTVCEDAISREAVEEIINDIRDCISVDGYWAILERLKKLPSVNPQRTGHWIEIAQYSDGKHKIECSECGSHIFDRGHANSFNVKNKYKYCPNCGCRMVESQESEKDKDEKDMSIFNESDKRY